MYTDGIYTDLCRERGRALRGIPAADAKSGRAFRRTGTAAALQGRAAIAPLCYGGTAQSAFFEDWFKNWLLPRVPKGYTVIVDNASFHRKQALRKTARGNVRLLFLPPYSPDFSPIEKTRAHIKKRLRGNASCFDTLESAVYAYL